MSHFTSSLTDCHVISTSSTCLTASQLHVAMVNHHNSKDLKECALWLWDLGWDEADMIQGLAVSHASIYYWRAIFEELRTVIKPPSPLQGHTHIIC